MSHLFAIGDVGRKAQGNFSRTYVSSGDDIDASVLVSHFLSSNRGFGGNWEQNQIGDWTINSYSATCPGHDA
jgi:hypothetical protein